MKKFIWLLLVLPMHGQLDSPASLSFGARIAGTLKGEDGSVIPDGIVGLQPVVANAANWRLNIDTRSSRTSVDGSFGFDRVRPGSYQVCVQVPRSAWINPCEWSTDSSTISFLRSDTVNTTIVLKKGAFVTIRVEDDNGYLERDEGKTPGAHLMIGIGNATGTFRHASVVSRDSFGRSYQVLIPFDYAAKLLVFSSYFRVSDSSGFILNGTTANSIPITVAPGQAAPTVRLAVIGRNRP